MNLRSLVAVFIALALASPAAALIIIDDFETGDYNVVDNTSTPGATSAEQTGLDPNSVIGGVRRTLVNASGTTGLIATAALVTTGGDDSLLLTTANSATFNLYYDGIGNDAFDGTAGALNLDLSGHTDLRFDVESPGTTGDLRVYLFDSSGSQFVSLITIATGAVNVSLGLFNLVDLSDIQAMRFFIDNVSLSNSVAISNIAAVPEPSTALLLGAGLAALSIRRRSRR